MGKIRKKGRWRGKLPRSRERRGGRGGYPIDGGGVVGALLERVEVAEQRLKLLLLHGRLAAACLLLCSSAAGAR
jgi:hypothetical protein